LRRFYPSLEQLLLTIWIGGMWVVGYLVAPVVFSLLADRAVAGMVAGRVFHFMSVIGLVCGVSLLVLTLMQHQSGSWRRWQTWVLLGMLLLIALALFFLQPAIEALRDSGAAARSSTEFKRLHGISSILYLLSSIGGLLLVWFGVARQK
jgi:MFS family permease